MRYALIVFVLAACSAHATRVDAAEVYKWKDANGVVHYADSPPDGQTYERVKISSGTTTTSASAEAAAPAEAAPPAEGSVEEAIARNNAVRAQNCQIARSNLAMFEASADVQKDIDGDGTPERLTPEQREAEIVRNRELAGRSCAE